MKSVNSPISMRPAQRKVSQEFISNRQGGANSPFAAPGGGRWGPETAPQQRTSGSATTGTPSTNFANYRK